MVGNVNRWRSAVSVPVFLATSLASSFFVIAAETPLSSNKDTGFKSGNEQACAQMLGFTGTAINDAARKVAVNGEACAAYKFLIEHMGNGTRGTQCYKSQTDRITKLNPQFAIGLHKALEAMEKQYGGKNIVQSGYRCDGSNGNHPKGCAADIIWASCRAKSGDAWRCSSDRFDAPEQKWIDANGKNAPYNIHLRLRFAPEGHHVEPVNVQGCRTGSIVGTGPGDRGAPSSQLTDMLRQSLGLDQQPQQQQPQPQYQQQPLPQSQQPTQYFPSSGTGQQTPTSGTSGQSPVSALSPASQQYLGVTQSDTQPQVSIADQLLQMAYGTTSTQQPQNTGTTVPVHLNSNDIGTMQSNPTAVTPSVGTQPTQDVPIGSLQPGQTFTSPDLGYAPSVPQTYPTESTGVFRVLETMKSVLLRMLEILRPMGIRDAIQGIHVNEYAE